MALTEQSAKLRGEALKRVYKTTREKWDPEGAAIYVERSAHYSTETFLLACRRLEASQWFPKLRELLDECRIVNQRRMEEREQAKRRVLDQPQVSPEKVKQMRRMVQEFLDARKMR